MKDHRANLTDALTLLRVEIADVKNRQITEKQLKHLLAALEKTAVQVEAVAQSAGEGAERALQPLSRQMGHTRPKICKTALSGQYRASQRH